MGALALDGKALARTLEGRLAERVRALQERHGGEPPVLAILLVGAGAAALRYARLKGEACRRVGLESWAVGFPAAATTATVLSEVARLNDDPRVRGIFLQYPVPSRLDARRCFDRIAIEKDVGGDGSESFGRLALGDHAFGPATPAGIMRLLSGYGIPLESKEAVVVWRDPILMRSLARPMALMLLGAHATVTICHAQTPDLPEIVQRAKLVVGAAGSPQLIRGHWVRRGAVVIDAGYHPGGVGDVELPAAAERCSAYTPVPGGVGPMTIAILLERTVESAERALLSPHAAGGAVRTDPPPFPAR